MLYLFVSIHSIVPAFCQCEGLSLIFLSRQLASHQLSKFWGQSGKVSMAFQFLKDSLDSCHSFFPPGTVNTSPDSCCLYWSEKSAIFSKIYPRLFFWFFFKILYLPSRTIRYWDTELFKCNPLKLNKLLGWYFNLLLSNVWKFWTSSLQIFSLTISVLSSYFTCLNVMLHWILKLYSFSSFIYC